MITSEPADSNVKPCPLLSPEARLKAQGKEPHKKMKKLKKLNIINPK